MIDQGTIDRILDAAQIVEVVSEFVTLRKRGVNYVGLCPFHNEKTPSFSVSPSKGLCKCFSCGKGGNAVHFVMEHEQLSYYEALKFLARKYHIEVKERELSNEEKEAQSTRESMFIVNEFAKDYFQQILTHHADGKAVGMGYFRQRGFRDDTIHKFQLGFSTEQRDALAKEAVRKGYKTEFLTKTGLCYPTDDNQLRDRFWGRVIFPIHTLSGKVVAFGGRVLKSDAKTAKYVNSPESDIYHKSSELYGIYFAKQAIVKQDRCFLVEGYTDVISMHQAGIENVVSSSGTSLTTGQIRLIHRFTDNITVLYDGDMAGIRASIRGIDMLLEEGMNIKVVLLPDGDDPDSFARKHHATDFQQYIGAHETDFIRFKTSLLLDEAGNDPIKKAALIGDIVRSIAVIPEPIVRSVYTKECSQLLKVEEKLLLAEINKLMKAQAEKGSGKPSAPLPTPTTQEAGQEQERPENTAYKPFLPGNTKEEAEFYVKERHIIRTLIKYGEQVVCHIDDEKGNLTPVTVTEYVTADLEEDELSFHNPLHRKVLSQAAAQMNRKEFVAKRFFLSHPDQEISRLAADLLNENYLLRKSQKEQMTKEEERLLDLVTRQLIDFKSAVVKEELQHVLRQLQDPANANDPPKCLVLMQRYKELCQLQNLMAKRQGDRVINV